MHEHGRSTLPTNETDRILDRLAGLEKVIPPPLIVNSCRPPVASMAELAN